MKYPSSKPQEQEQRKRKLKTAALTKLLIPKGEHSWPEKNNIGTTKDNRTDKRNSRDEEFPHKPLLQGSALLSHAIHYLVSTQQTHSKFLEGIIL